jgi:hypothetical protein
MDETTHLHELQTMIHRFGIDEPKHSKDRLNYQMLRTATKPLGSRLGFREKVKGLGFREMSGKVGKVEKSRHHPVSSALSQIQEWFVAPHYP